MAGCEMGMGYRFNPPPNWPAPPPGWVPSPGWRPSPEWPAPPPGWRLWIDDMPPAPSQGRTVQRHARHTGRGFREQLGAALGRHKILTGVGAFIALSLVVYAADPHAAGSGAHSAPTPAATGITPAASRPVPKASISVVASPSPTLHKPSFPPTTLAAFRAFASTGDASQVHQVGTSSEGLPSCPEPNIYVTINPALNGKALEADLSAFFVQKGLINNSCQAFLFAYHTDYQAHLHNGYTVGRVALTNTGPGSQRNLEVDVGEVTSDSYNVQAQFEFNF